MNPLTSIIAAKAAQVAAQIKPSNKPKVRDKDLLSSLSHPETYEKYGKLITAPLTKEDISILSEMNAMVESQYHFNDISASSLTDLRKKISKLPKGVLAYLEASTWNWRKCNTEHIFTWLQVRPATNTITPSQAIALTERGQDLPKNFRKLLPDMDPQQLKTDLSVVLPIATHIFFNNPKNLTRYTGSNGLPKLSGTEWLKLCIKYYPLEYVATHIKALDKSSSETFFSRFITFLNANKLSIPITNLVFPTNPINPYVDDANNCEHLVRPNLKAFGWDQDHRVWLSADEAYRMVPASQQKQVVKLLHHYHLPYLLAVDPKTKALAYSPTKEDARKLVHLLFVSAFKTKVTAAQRLLIQQITALLSKKELMTFIPTIKAKESDFNPINYSPNYAPLMSVYNLLGLSKKEILTITKAPDLDAELALKLIRNQQELIAWLEAGAELDFLSRILNYCNEVHPAHAQEAFKGYKRNILTLSKADLVVEALNIKDAAALSSLLDFLTVNKPATS